MIFEKNSNRTFLGKTPFYYGATLEVGNRFEKNGNNSLKLSSGLSLGPSASFSPIRNWSLRITAPLTGLFFQGWLSGPVGLKILNTYDIPLAHYQNLNQLILSIKLSAYRFYWKSPEGTNQTQWDFGLGPTLFF